MLTGLLMVIVFCNACVVAASVRDGNSGVAALNAFSAGFGIATLARVL